MTLTGDCHCVVLAYDVIATQFHYYSKDVYTICSLFDVHSIKVLWIYQYDNNAFMGELFIFHDIGHLNNITNLINSKNFTLESFFEH